MNTNQIIDAAVDAFRVWLASPEATVGTLAEVIAGIAKQGQERAGAQVQIEDLIRRALELELERWKSAAIGRTHLRAKLERSNRG